MKLQDLDLENEDFIIATYKLAAKDYVKAIILGDIREQNINREFFESWAFGISTKTGKFIANQLPKEVRIAENLIASFLANYSEELYLNKRKVVVWIVKTIVDIKYSSECKVKMKCRSPFTSFYLVKRH